jgi:hypothetical protein
MKPKNPMKEVSEDPKKKTASGNKVEIHRMKMTKTSGKVLGISQEHKMLMETQQNMTKLHHETWCEKSQTYIKSRLPEEPTLRLRMNLNIHAYAKHSPPLKCMVRREWKESMIDNKQFDIVLPKSTADTGAQCFLLGADYLPDLGLSVEDLLQSEINLNCANTTAAGNLGVFYAKIRGVHWKTGEVVESKSMVYVFKGSIVLISREVLETLGCIPKQFPRVGQFLEPDDKALTENLLLYFVVKAWLMRNLPMMTMKLLIRKQSLEKLFSLALAHKEGWERGSLGGHHHTPRTRPSVRAWVQHGEATSG